MRFTPPPATTPGGDPNAGLEIDLTPPSAVEAPVRAGPLPTAAIFVRDDDGRGRRRSPTSKQAALHDSDAAAATFNTCVNIQRMKRLPLIA